MFLWVLWATLAINPTQGRGHRNLWFIASHSEVRETALSYDWHPDLRGHHWKLQFVASWSDAQITTWACDRHLKWQVASGTEPLTCGIWFYLQVESVRIQLNSQTSCWHLRTARWCREVYTHAHTHTHTHTKLELGPGTHLQCPTLHCTIEDLQ